MANIGFSTGSLHRAMIPFEERIRLYSSSGADAIELGFATPIDLLDYQLSVQSKKDIKEFRSVSIHAPWKGVRYGLGEDTRKLIDKLAYLCDELPISGIVLHPDRIDDFDMIDRLGLPFLLENMDIRKSYAIHPAQFKEFANRYQFGFVLDVQHAYEHDSSMKLAREFIETMGGRLKHMHVSGNNLSEIHVPVFQSDNKESILEILKLRIDVPKIFEGIILGDFQNVVRQELMLIRSLEM